MAQYLWLPNPAELNSSPSDWTSRFGNTQLTVKQDGGGRYYLEMSAPSGDVSVVTLDTINGVDVSNIGDCQVFGEYQREAASGSLDTRQLVKFSGTAFSNAQGRAGGLEDTVSERVRLTSILNGSDNNESTVFLASIAAGQTYFQYLESIGDQQKAKVVIDDDGEGGEWDAETTSSVGLQASGRIGQYRFADETSRLYAFGVGTNGDLPPVGPGPSLKAHVLPFDGFAWSNGVTNIELNFPTNIEAGDTLIIISAVRAGTVDELAGWTTIGNTGGSNTDMKVFYKKAVSGDAGATVTVTHNGGGNNGTNANARGFVIGNAADPDVTPPEASFDVLDVDGFNPDPPSLTPTGGAKDYLWITGMFVRNDSEVDAYPSDYLQVREFDNGGGGDANTIATCLRSANLATDDPSAYTIGPNAGDWSTTTIAVHPAAPTIVYNLEWRDVSTQSTTQVNGITDLLYELSGLTAGTDYEFRVQSDDGTDQSEWSEWFQFTTTGGGGGTINLISNDIESTSSVSTPTVGQIHNLLSNDIESSSTVDSPSLNIVFGLNSVNIESISEVSSPALTQIHNLLSNDNESASSVSTPTVGQIHNLLSNNIEALSSTSSPTVGQVHNLFTDVVESSTETSQPAVGQVHNLLSNNIESTSSVSTTSNGQIHNLSSNDVDSTSSVSTPIIGQVHNLLSNDVEGQSSTNRPILNDTSNIDSLTSTNIESASSVSTPTVGQIHNLLSDNVEASSSTNQPVSGQVHNLLSNDNESASSVSTPTVGQIHNLLSNDADSQTTTSQPNVGQVHNLLSNNIESTSSVSTPVVGQVHNLNNNGLSSRSETSQPSINQVHNLISTNVESTSETSSPLLSVPAADADNLISVGVESASSVSEPALGQVHNLFSEDAEAASNTSEPTVSQVHNLFSKDIEALSNTSEVFITQKHALFSTDSEGSSEVSEPVLGHNYVLFSTDSEAASSVSSPNLSHIYNLISENVEGGGEVSSPQIQQTHVLIGDDVQALSVVGSPMLRGGLPLPNWINDTSTSISQDLRSTTVIQEVNTSVVIDQSSNTYGIKVISE